MRGKLAGLGDVLLALGLHCMSAFQNTRACLDEVLHKQQTAERRRGGHGASHAASLRSRAFKHVGLYLPGAATR